MAGSLVVHNPGCTHRRYKPGQYPQIGLRAFFTGDEDDLTGRALILTTSFNSFRRNVAQVVWASAVWASPM